MKPTGTYIKASMAGESFQAFIPNPLPPDPPVKLAEQDHDLVEKANRALGRLDGVATQLPDISLFRRSRVHNHPSRICYCMKKTWLPASRWKTFRKSATMWPL